MTVQQLDVTTDCEQSQAMRMCDDPTGFFANSYTEMQSIPPDKLAQLHIEGLQLRFAQLRDRIPMLKTLADRQGVDGIDTLDDVVPLLFEHTMYKSYPPALLEKARFGDINRFLSKLTTHDLTTIDVSHCEEIDEWLALMDRESPLRITHSSGTTGVMSFLPTSKVEWDKFGRAQRIDTLHVFGDASSEADDADDLYCVYPYFRDGGSTHLRVNDNVVKFLLNGDESRFISAYPTRMSSDVLYLAARLRAAQARGELDRLQISPRLLARRKEFEALEAQMPAHLDAFFERAINDLKGKRVYLGATWNIAHSLARRGLDNGLEGVFAKNSILVSGGGAKNMTPPDNWKEECCRFFGIDRIKMVYAMSEVFGSHYACEHGHYHFAPWVIPFLLDPETSKPLPRTGKVTGRAAFFDLSAETRWGGFITGDEITVNWDQPCACGRTSAHVVGEIRRYSEKKGGDDKISCAATEEAHKEAMDFLTNFN